MPKSIEIPLHLCQVLEEEFENLHGALGGEEFSVKDEEGREVGAFVNVDWGFYKEHVSASGMTERLRDALRQWRQNHYEDERPDDAETDVAAYLALSDGELREALKAEGVVVGDELLIGVLNKALKDTELFVKERFERLSLRDETRGLIEVGWAGDRVEFDAKAGSDDEWPKSDLARFRRLLLEDAFPGEIRRVYDLRVNRIVRRIHGLRPGRSAICLSGGGIRSGTFALGVIQSLSGRGLLEQFDFLSTVSGGGYIGGWLSAWIHRHPAGLRGVIRDLNGETRDTKVEPEPRPLQHLRDFSSFVTPRTGLLSADTWTFVVIYIRNLLLNWVVLVPLAASVLMIPRVAVAALLAAPSWKLLAGLLAFGGASVLLLRPGLFRLRGEQALLFCVVFATAFAVVGLSALLSRYGWASAFESVGWGAPTALLAAGTLLGGYAVAYMRLNRPSNSGVVGPESFWSKHRDQNSFLWLCLLPLCVSASLLTTFWAWFRHQAHNADSPRVLLFGAGLPKFLGGGGLSEIEGFMFFGLLLGFTGWLLYVALAGSLKNWWRELVITLAGSVVGAILLYAFAVNVGVFYAPINESLARYALYLAPALVRPYGSWDQAELYTCLAFPVYLLIYFFGITLYVGLTSRRSEHSPKGRRGEDEAGAGGAGGPLLSFDKIFIGDEDREWLARACAWLFIAAAGWLFFSLLVVFGPLLLFALGKWLTAAGGVSGLVTILGGGSSKTPGHSKKEAKPGVLASLGVNLVVVASFVFFACLVVLVSLLSGTLVAWLAKYLPALLTGPQTDLFRAEYPLSSPENIFRVTHFPAWYYLFALAIALNVFGRVFSRLVNLNKFSLHAGYRDRIIRAFLGASRLTGERRPNPFTGFDPRDNLYMDELRPWQLRESDFKEPGGLASFVAALAGQTKAAVGAQEGAAKESRRAAAKHLREEIERVKGESVKYLKDPPESINTNPSFRSALFADLSRILQVSPLDKAGAFGPHLDKAKQDYRELAPRRGGTDRRVLLNRLLLLRAFPESLKYPPRLYALMHVVNMTLNLAHGKRLAWQQRRAESFTSTPLHSGSLFVGYRPTRDYGGKTGISLGTAIATSGAAASSNMGYFSPSPFVTLVLTFFNARLGWWLGNPGVAGFDTYFRSHPKKALSPILDEAFGLTDDTNPYVLLSDGGHFENLGLYEMVMRRCRHVVVVDGSADPEGDYDDLGGAVRKIRIDFGINIEFEPPFLILSRPESEKKKGAYCAVGKIHYEDVDGEAVEPGTIIYVKPAIYGGEPRDVFNYARSHGDFPHESTADQFFDEPQFESHRMLGYYALESLFDGAREQTSPAASDGGPDSIPSPGVVKIPPPIIKAPRAAGDIAEFFSDAERKAEKERNKAKSSAEGKGDGGGGTEESAGE